MIADLLCTSWASAATPPPLFTVSEWADAKRMLPEASGARGGPWRTSAVPYLRGIMDAVHEPGVKKIALRKCAQVGGSEAINNIIGYFIEHDSCPILLVQPSASVADEYSKERLADMIQSTPALRKVVHDRKTRGAHRGDSTLTMKLFPGGFLALGGANTPNTFARRAARIAIGDDVDRFPPVVGEEGDPADLLVKRTTTFHNGLVILVSTPTLKGGRIDTLFTRGDQRQYFVECPRCGREDWITWSDTKHFRVAYDDRDPSTARIECPSENDGGCGAHLSEATRRRMVMAGEWVPTATAQEPGLVSFHLPAMVTTLGAASLQSWVSDWIASRQKGKESTRVFINTTLGEGWEDRGTRMESHTLLDRRGVSWVPGVEVPEFVSVLTCGVDVQLDRFELQVIGWGLAGERAVVDYRVIDAAPKLPEARASLLEALARTYTHALGPQLPIRATCIDSGHWTDDIYEFVLANHNEQTRPLYATKGVPGRGGNPIVGKRTEQKSGKSQRKIWLYPINTDDAKGDVYGALSVVTPGPGYIHFPSHLDTVHEEYFAQLCAERRVTKYNKAKVATHTEWEQMRDRNEALDTFVMALAAFRILNPNLHQMRQRIVAAVRPALPATSAPPAPLAQDTKPTPAPAAKPARRVARSKYLG